MLLLLALPLASSAGVGGPLVLTSQWSPPDLSGADALTPELLVLRVAQEEVGYREGPLPDQSKYGEWFGNPQAAWCSEFVTWCVHEADLRWNTRLLGSVYPFSGGPATGAPFYIEAGRFVSDTGRLVSNERQWFVDSREYVGNNAYIPHPGDLVWFCYYTRGKTDHTAIVEGVSRGESGEVRVHIIEGNNPDSVRRSTVALTDRSVYGYGTPTQRVMTNLRLHNRGANVRRLRELLVKTGRLKDHEDNADEFTVEVRTLVQKFQTEQGIPATGVADMETWLALEAAVGE